MEECVYLEKWLQILMGSENYKSESMCFQDLTAHRVKFRKIGFLTIAFFPLSIVSILNKNYYNGEKMKGLAQQAVYKFG